MARTEQFYWRGKVNWCRPHQPDPWGNWKTNFYPIPEHLEQIRKLKETDNGVSGIKNTIKKDEDGEFIVLRRPQQKMMKGKVTGFSPPEVLDGSKTLEDGSNPPLRDTPIGNGSDVTVKVSVYQHGTPGGGKAKAMRWDAVRIDNLVPFVKKGFSEEEGKQIGDLMDQPKPKF